MIKKLLTEKNTSILIEIMSVGLILFFGLIVFSNNTFDFSFYRNGDVHRGFLRGIDVWAGVNSYESFNPTNMLTQEKVPGFFPLYFYVMAFFAWISNFSFIQFIDTLRFFTFIFYSALGILIYLNLRKYGKLLAVFGMVIFMFNRWTVFDVISLKQESYVLLLLLLSLLTLSKNKYFSFFLFGCALGIKHLAILIAPLYIYHIYLDYLSVKLSKKFFTKYLFSILLCLSPILIPSIWYLRQNPQKMLNAILFNATRQPESEVVSNYIVGLDKTLVLYNQDYSNTFLLMLPRFPLIIVLVIINIFLFSGHLNKWSYSFLTFLAFVSFNPVLFGQYMMWLFLFVPFIIGTLFENQLFKNK